MHDYAFGLNYALDAVSQLESTAEGGFTLTAANGLKCPICRSNDNIPIFYGFPSQHVQRAVERGEIELGGCVILEERPSRHCKNCGHYFSLQQFDFRSSR